MLPLFLLLLLLLLFLDFYSLIPELFPTRSCDLPYMKFVSDRFIFRMKARKIFSFPEAKTVFANRDVYDILAHISNDNPKMTKIASLKKSTILIFSNYVYIFFLLLL